MLRMQVFLNDGAPEAETRFTHLKLPVAPKRGRALIWFPTFNGGVHDPRSRIESEQVGNGHTLWVAQQFLLGAVARAVPGKRQQKQEKPSRKDRAFAELDHDAAWDAHDGQ